MIQIAHRGYSDLYKDNSKEAFLKAIDAKFDMIELDVQLSKDNVLIIHHDTFYKSNLLKNFTYEEIKQFDSDILTLSEFFHLIDTTSIKIYLDIKGNDLSICPVLLDFLKGKNLKNIYIASFNLYILEYLQEYFPHVKYGIITSNSFSPSNLLQINCSNIHFFCIHWEMITKDVIDTLHERNILVYTYTCKNNDIFSFIKQYNVDGIVTNYKIDI